MTTIHYLDPSAWVKRYFDEPGSDRVSKIMRSGMGLTCSKLGPIELMSEIARRERAGLATPAQAERVGDRAVADLDAFTLIELDRQVWEIALGIPRAHALRGADAVHLASAIVVRDAIRSEGGSVVFVASDQALLRAADAVRFPTIDPERP